MANIILKYSLKSSMTILNQQPRLVATETLAIVIRSFKEVPRNPTKK